MAGILEERAIEEERDNEPLDNRLLMAMPIFCQFLHSSASSLAFASTYRVLGTLDKADVEMYKIENVLMTSTFDSRGSLNFQSVDIA